LRFNRDQFASPPQLATRHIEDMIGKSKQHLGAPRGRIVANFNEQSHGSQGRIKRP
jgi:hypothetical protein